MARFGFQSSNLGRSQAEKTSKALNYSPSKQSGEKAQPQIIGFSQRSTMMQGVVAPHHKSSGSGDIENEIIGLGENRFKNSSSSDKETDPEENMKIKKQDLKHQLNLHKLHT